MKVVAFFHGILFKNQIVLRTTDGRDLPLVKKMFDSKKSREKRTGREILLKCEIDAPLQKRTFKQLGAIWKLVEIIFMSSTPEMRKPTKDEMYDLYLDLLELYADKTPSKITGELRPVHISESNTMAAARLIDGLLYHLANECDLNPDLQADVRSVIYEWEEWRGKRKLDLNDFRSVAEMRELVTYSEASGRSPVDFHHIVSRGSAPQFADCAWNILALTREEHEEFHRKGWGHFLNKYPHLRPKVHRAFRKAGHLSVPDGFMEATMRTYEEMESLVQEAMED